MGIQWGYHGSLIDGHNGDSDFYPIYGYHHLPFDDGDIMGCFRRTIVEYFLPM
jgi:hypothetical protein